MIYDWYKIYNLTEFNALSLTSIELEIILTGNALKEIMITKGNYVGVLIDDVFLPINLNSKNPFEFEDRAVYLDSNNDIWVGIAVE